MRLLRFRVTNFRSVDDSGWIEASDVTALIGTNESGKTNLLLPLWKLNPAGEDGQIDLLADAPRKRYNQIRSGDQDEVFIEAVFEPSAALAQELAELAGASPEDMAEVKISRVFDGTYRVGFPKDNPTRALPRSAVEDPLRAALVDIAAAAPLKSEETLKTSIIGAVNNALATLPEGDRVNAVAVRAVQAALTAVSTEGAPKSSVIAPRLAQLREVVEGLLPGISRPAAYTIAEARKAALNALPTFVYYSNYGNLDSEIYLPHVIANMERTGIGAKEAAKARTLKVLFEFVKLSAKEILELGRELPTNPAPTEQQVAEIAKKKKQRDVLLQSASTELTASFRDWWKQGEYRFRFQADGDHFRIWVSDDKRPEDIELEGRSTGLQWFLSFYLIFLVESGDAHENAVLLLDEPGLSLHPLAQRDLSLFFENLAETNQLLYTTHSPFLVDPNHLDRVRAVFVQDDGTTGVSSDLRAGEKKPAQTKSIYPVHAALGITVSDTLLLGSDPVIVEGQSDQFYLSAMKTLLIAAGRIAPARELVFVPAGGVRGVKAVAGILGGKDEVLPCVLVDSDNAGRQLIKDLRSGLYSGASECVIEVGTYAGVENAEVEDLIPESVIVPTVTKMLRGPDEDFADVFKAGEAIVPQIERYAKTHGIELTLGWKVELARQVKARLLKVGPDLDSAVLDRWQKMFAELVSTDDLASAD